MKTAKISVPQQVLIEFCRDKKLPVPVPEHQFHETRKWRFDLAWPDHFCAMEIDGGTWIEGRHTRGVGFEEDCEKGNEAALLGYFLFHVTPKMVNDGRAFRVIERMFE